MRLTNCTDIPNDLIREIIRFVSPATTKNIRFRIWKCRQQYSGRGGSGEVTIKIAQKNTFKFPLVRPPRKAYIGFTLYSYEEILVYLLAHEIRHCWQSEHKKGWRYYGSKGQYSERDASCYGLHMVREWRRR